MPKTHGATDKAQRKRREKTDAEREKTKQQKQKKQNTAKSLFFTPKPRSRDPPAPPPVVEKGEQEESESVPDDVVYQELRAPIFTAVVPEEEITAELDAEDREDADQIEDDEDGDFETEHGHGDTDDVSVMKIYLLAIRTRLRKEMSSTTMNSKEKWMLELLEYDEWWIESKRASKVCTRLGIQFAEKSYYRDVRVWFPELQYGQDCMPSCVSCGNNCKVGVHAYSKTTYARRVVALTTNYFVMSRQYICHVCSKLNKERKTRAAGGAYEKVRYTFMGYNADVLTQLPDGKGAEFPAFLTHKSGIDNLILDLMRPLHDKGLRPHALSDTLVELHSKKYTDDYIKRERLLSKKMALGLESPGLFSRFSDKSKYDGLVPTGRYLSTIYNKHGKSLRQHYCREVKKRGCDRFHMDASYKAPKRLFQYHGHPIFHALITATNQFREVRLQQLCVTDGHDQLKPAIRAMLETMAQYGQPAPKLAITDNSLRDRNMLVEEMKSLSATQDVLNELMVNEAGHGAGSNAAGSALNVGAESNGTPVCKIDDRRCYSVVSSVVTINLLAVALRETVKGQSVKVVSLDCEWDTDKNADGQVTRSYKVALIQVGYRDLDGTIWAALFQVSRVRVLPAGLCELFRDQEITFIGVGVAGDLKKIGRDFECAVLTSKTRYINLGKYARERDVVKDGTVGMQYLVLIVMKQKLDKSPLVRLSKWSRPDLALPQTDYAALDAIKPLEVFFKISSLPDLNSRLGPDEAIPEMEVDVVPKHGYAPDMATRGAVGTITKYTNFVSPDGFMPALLKTNAARSRIVKVTKVYSPFLLVPEMKKNGKAACLGDFGKPPFNIIVSLGMLKNHVQSDHVRSFPRPLHGQVPPRVTPPATAPNRPTTATATNQMTNPTNPATNLMTNSATNPATNPPTNATTNRATNPATNQATNGTANRMTNPATNRATNRATNVATNPTTIPATNPVPDPPTNAATNPPTNPPTNATTNRVTVPTTNPATNRATDATANAATNPTTIPATNPVTNPPTNTATNPPTNATTNRATVPTTNPTSDSDTDSVTNPPAMDDTLFDSLFDVNRDTRADSDDEDHENDERREMEAEDIDLIEAARVLAEAATSGDSNRVLRVLHAFVCENLDKPPEWIQDVFSSVLGDAFHEMKRPHVPIKHEFKKPYFVALMRAWFCWNEKKLRHVCDVLKANDWTEDEIKKKMYYHPRFFHERVERRILPPSKLYWRVRAVYVKFGNKRDSKTLKPLFNKQAWKRANSVLHEILRGEASDPPGFEFYTQRLDAKGESQTDKYGIQLLDCNRGTNDVENEHKQYVTTFGTWCAGVETSCTLLAERRHRHNHRMSESYRVGFPVIGHYDTWKIDLLQILVEKNHGKRLYAYWVNSSDYKDTDESFDVVALHSSDLHAATMAIPVDPEVLRGLSRELKFIAECMGVPLPFLPVHGEDEGKLFVRLVLVMGEAFDADHMALEWCKYVDGKTIFPKLPVYLRAYHDRYLRNTRVKDAVAGMKSDIELLENLNKELLPEHLREQDDEVLIEQDNAVFDSLEERTQSNIGAGWPHIPLPSIMWQPDLIARRPAGLGPPVVERTMIGIVTSPEAPPTQRSRKRGERGRDSTPRAKRRCRLCVQNNGINSQTCNGGKSGGTRACQYFS